MKKFCLAIPLLFILLFTFTACSNSADTSKETGLLEFDLGQGVLENSDGRLVPYEIQGVLGIPEEKNCPVVVLVHGSHPIKNASEDRYDIGFNYLTQALSEQGNLVISMNVGINYSFEDGEPIGNERTKQIITQQLEFLSKAVDGDKTIYGRDLSDAGDFSHVVLMGHSRGGMDVLEWASEAPDNIGVSGIVSVAPSFYKEFETTLPNVPVGIIIPQFDGDVILLGGNDFYELYTLDKAYTKNAELIYLKGANHGHFNTQLTQPDLNSTPEDIKKLIPAEKQREFLVNYMTDFVRSVTESGQTPFAASNKLENSAYDCNVLLRVYFGTSSLLYCAEDSTELTGANITKEFASFYPAQNTVELFRMPGASVFEKYALQHIVWTKPASRVAVPITASSEGIQFLDIDMAIDSTDMKNTDGLSMTVSIRDKSGNTANFDIDRTAGALQWQEGEIIENVDWDGAPYREYSTFTPLVTLRLDLRELDSLNINEIEEICFSWDAPSGSIMLRSIRGI